MHAQRVEGNSEQAHAEAVEDGTALIGHVAPDRTDRVDLPDQATRSHSTADAIGRDWHRISGKVAHLYSTGVAENDPRTQEAIGEHYRWICHFWTPDRDSYIRLAQMYVSQPKFRRRIERRKPAGMAAYMRDAMTAYARARLA